jgi:penicillin amidase
MWEDGKHALALDWIGTEPGTVPYLASLSVDRANNWNDFLGAMNRWKSPPENIVYADRAGNIGEQSAGLTPIRKGWNGLLPVPGASDLQWAGFIPLDQLPRKFNPPEKYYATANNENLPSNFPYDVGHSWSETRVARINEVLTAARDAGKKLSIKDLEDLQNDVVSLPARDLIALLSAAHPTTATFKESAERAAKILFSWNQHLDEQSSAAALFEVWKRSLSRWMAAEILHRMPDRTISISPSAMLKELQNPSANVFCGAWGDLGEGMKWVEDSLPAAQLRDEMLWMTLAEAQTNLEKLLGSDPQKWNWGALHREQFHHSLEKYSAWTVLLDPPPVSRPGDGETVDATSGDGYDQTHGASYREILDVADWDRSVSINVPGESGQPLSPHYADLLRLWARGEYFPLLFSPQAVQQKSSDRLVLQPQ